MASDPWESSLPQEDRKPNSAQPSRLDKAAGGDWRDQSGFIRPHPTAILRAALGVFLAVGAVGLLVLMCSFPFPDLMFVPSFGATATLLFGNPASIHAQPWPAIAGNTAAATTGVIIGALFPVPVLDVALSVCVGLIVIVGIRAFHPPAGAVAVTAVLSSDAGLMHGFQYIVAPVFVGMSLIVVFRVLYATLLSEGYPIGRQDRETWWSR